MRQKIMMKLFSLIIIFSIVTGSKVQAQTLVANAGNESSLIEDTRIEIEDLKVTEIKELSKEIGVKPDRILSVRKMVVPNEITKGSNAFIAEGTKNEIEIPVEYELKKIVVEDDKKGKAENYYMLSASSNVKDVYGGFDNAIHLTATITWQDNAGPNNKLISVSGGRTYINPNKTAMYSYAKTGFADGWNRNWSTKGNFQEYPNISGYGFRLDVYAYNSAGEKVSVHIHTSVFQ